jgi:hypothetical protein
MLSPRKEGLGHSTYERHRPEQTLLYQLVEKHYPVLVNQLAQQGKSLPDHVYREFEAHLKRQHQSIHPHQGVLQQGDFQESSGQQQLRDEASEH